MYKLFFFFIVFFGYTVSAQDLSKTIDSKSRAIQPKLAAWRQHLHQYPELSNREFNTQKYILAHLKALNIEAFPLAKTGVVAVLKGDKPGPVIALRYGCIASIGKRKFKF